MKSTSCIQRYFIEGYQLEPDRLKDQAPLKIIIWNFCRRRQEQEGFVRRGKLLRRVSAQQGRRRGDESSSSAGSKPS